MNTLDPASVSDKTSYCKISQILEAARFVFRIVWSLWKLINTLAAVLPMCLLTFRAMQWFKLPISWLRPFRRCYDKTSYQILRQCPCVRKSIIQSTAKSCTYFPYLGNIHNKHGEMYMRIYGCYCNQRAVSMPTVSSMAEPADIMNMYGLIWLLRTPESCYDANSIVPGGTECCHSDKSQYHQ